MATIETVPAPARAVCGTGPYPEADAVGYSPAGLEKDGLEKDGFEAVGFEKVAFEAVGSEAVAFEAVGSRAAASEAPTAITGGIGSGPPGAGQGRGASLCIGVVDAGGAGSG